MPHGQVIDEREGVQLEVEASLATQTSQEQTLLPLIWKWLAYVRATILTHAEHKMPDEYHLSDDIGDWTVRVVRGRDTRRSAFAIQVWLRNGVITRFMAIFAYRERMLYNIDIKLLDARFAWWALRLQGVISDDE